MESPRVANDEGEVVNGSLKKASFLIFTQGLRRDFSGTMYEHRSDDAYLGGGQLGVITVVKSRVTWRDFFLTLPFSLTETCLTTGLGQQYCDGDGGSLTFVLNGVETPTVLDRVIREGDRLLVTFGNAGEGEIMSQMEQVPNPR